MQIFKMPPFFEFQTQELIETALEFYKAGVLKPPYKECIFETDYKIDEMDLVARMRFRSVETGPQQSNVVIDIRPTDDDRWKHLVTFILDAEQVDVKGLENHVEGRDEIAKWCIRVYLACCMILNMREFQQEAVTYGAKLQQRRAKAGKPPLQEYTRVYLNPRLKRIYEAGEGKGGIKRPHWRRGHIRKLRDGRMVPIAPMMINFKGEAIDEREYTVK